MGNRKWATSKKQFAYSPRSIGLGWVLVGLMLVGGCSRIHWLSGRHRTRGQVLQLACLYDLKPWLNLDRAGDRDPEGLYYTVLADTGSGQGSFVHGKFLIELYQIERDPSGKRTRRLVSDWVLPTEDVQQVTSKLWGQGYRLRLRWASKDIAGHEVEIVTRFKGANGQLVSAGVKQLHVPKYIS